MRPPTRARPLRPARPASRSASLRARSCGLRSMAPPRVLVLLAVVVLAAVAVIAALRRDTGRPPLVPAPAPTTTRSPTRPGARTRSPPPPRAATRTSSTPSRRAARARAPRASRATGRSSRPPPQTAGIEPDTLEAIVLLESAGRPDAAADPQLEGAVGLTQILAETGRNLLGMRVDPAGARRIGRSLRARRARGRQRADRPAARAPARVDERFDPPKALAATARYLRHRARASSAATTSRSSATTWASATSRARCATTARTTSPTRGCTSTPRRLRHAEAYRRLAALGDDSATYLWRVDGGARDHAPVPRRPRRARPRLARCRPPRTPPRRCCTRGDETEQFADPVAAARRLRRRGRIVALPRARLARARRARSTARMGELAARLAQRTSLYRGAARAGARAARLHRRRREGDLRHRAARRHEHACATRATSALLLRTQPRGDAELLAAHDRLGVRHPAHVRSRAQALAFQFLLDRLQSHEPHRLGARARRDPRDGVAGRAAAGRGPQTRRRRTARRARARSRAAAATSGRRRERARG